MSNFILVGDSFILNMDTIERVEKESGEDGSVKYATVYFVGGDTATYYGDHAEIVWDTFRVSSLQVS